MDEASGVRVAHAHNATHPDADFKSITNSQIVTILSKAIADRFD